MNETVKANTGENKVLLVCFGKVEETTENWFGLVQRAPGTEVMERNTPKGTLDLKPSLETEQFGDQQGTSDDLGPRQNCHPRLPLFFLASLSYRLLSLPPKCPLFRDFSWGSFVFVNLQVRTWPRE
ncbi:hypothetical protein KIL84_004501 [Mauremys mutica]|uniref:Uncharacterized protein n=1 Tax=Mauremys mutica TaxID=74926 RepID=A0A9D3XK83_9SAUR|nr:hypothetical protein KIL84_004501 [Mauremys mutica]